MKLNYLFIIVYVRYVTLYASDSYDILLCQYKNRYSDPKTFTKQN